CVEVVRRQVRYVHRIEPSEALAHPRPFTLHHPPGDARLHHSLAHYVKVVCQSGWLDARRPFHGLPPLLVAASGYAPSTARWERLLLATRVMATWVQVESRFRTSTNDHWGPADQAARPCFGQYASCART